MGSLLETEAHLQLDGLKVLSSKAKVSLTIKPLLLLLAHDAALHSLTPREVIEGLSSSHYIVERAPGCLLSFHISFRSLTYASPTEELCHKLASSIIEAPVST